MMTSYRCYLGFLLICNSLNNQAQIEGLVYSNAVWKRHKITKKIQKQDLQPTKYSNDEGKYLIAVFVTSIVFYLDEGKTGMMKASIV
jgi:hypothetical protein